MTAPLVTLLLALLLALAGAKTISRRRLADLLRPTRSRRRLGPDLLALLALALLLSATIPQTSTQKPTGPTIALVVDVSTSMTAADVFPNRLELARRELLTLVELLPQTRFALVPFAGEAVVQVSPTADRTALRFFIGQLQPGLIAADGSAPEEAVRLAQELLADEPGEPLVLLVGDGERTLVAPPQPLRADIPAWILPVGSESGAEVPGHPGSRTALDRQRLESLATASGGRLLEPATATATAKLLAATAPDHQALGAWLPLAALLLLVSRLIPWRVPRRGTLRRSVAAATLIALCACPAPESQPAESAAGAFVRGLQAADGGDLEQAAAAFSAAADRLDGEARGAALFNQATVLLQAGQPHPAVTLLENALLLLPGDAPTRDQLLLALQAAAAEPATGDAGATEENEAAGGEQLTCQQAEALLQSIDPDPATPPAIRYPAGRPVKAVW